MVNTRPSGGARPAPGGARAGPSGPGTRNRQNVREDDGKDADSDADSADDDNLADDCDEEDEEERDGDEMDGEGGGGDNNEVNNNDGEGHASGGDDHASEGTVNCSDSDFEGHDGYRKGGYHPVHIGEIYDSRFRVTRKLGWGHFSTVWLCADLENNEQPVAMKVQKSAQHYTEAAFDEIDILRTLEKETVLVQAELLVSAKREMAAEVIRGRLSDARAADARSAALASGADEATATAAGIAALANEIGLEEDIEEGVRAAAALSEEELLKMPSSSGGAPPPVYDPHVVRLISHFFHEGQHGKHMVMVFNVLGDNMLALIKAYRYTGIPAALVRRFTLHTCEALHFLHARCAVVHTDIKPENILLSGKLPPVPLPVEELEQIDTFEEDMDSAEEAVEAARERTRARKLGIRLEEPTGAEAEAATLAGLTGLARKRAKKKLQKKRAAAKTTKPSLIDVPQMAALAASVGRAATTALLAANFVAREASGSGSGSGADEGVPLQGLFEDKEVNITAPAEDAVEAESISLAAAAAAAAILPTTHSHMNILILAHGEFLTRAFGGGGGGREIVLGVFLYVSHHHQVMMRTHRLLPPS